MEGLFNSFFNLSTLGDLQAFIKQMVSYKLPFDNVFTVYVKVRYNVDSFFMVGNQFGFVFNSNSSLNGLFDNINDRLSDYFSYYNLEDDDIVYIQISFRLLDRKVYSDLSIDKTNLSYTSSTKPNKRMSLI